jgi:general secretion pathway protein I
VKIRGFTLIEVMVALFVIALSVGALLTTLVSSADTVGYLREKTFAQWVALNRVSEVRLGNSPPEQGITRDTVEYAGSVWSREQEVSDAGVGGLMRIDVRVGLLGAVGTTAAEGESPDDDGPPTLGSAIGFIGSSVARSSGLNPDWSPRGAAGGPGGEGGPGGGDGPGAGDGPDDNAGEQP